MIWDRGEEQTVVWTKVKKASRSPLNSARGLARFLGVFDSQDLRHPYCFCLFMVDLGRNGENGCRRAQWYRLERGDRDIREVMCPAKTFGEDVLRTEDAIW
jgi:hypothetical protein